MKRPTLPATDYVKWDDKTTPMQIPLFDGVVRTGKTQRFKNWFASKQITGASLNIEDELLARIDAIAADETPPVANTPETVTVEIAGRSVFIVHGVVVTSLRRRPLRGEYRLALALDQDDALVVLSEAFGMKKALEA